MSTTRPWFEWASAPLYGFRLGTVGFFAYKGGVMLYAGRACPLAFGLPLEWPNRRRTESGDQRVAFGPFALTWATLPEAR